MTRLIDKSHLHLLMKDASLAEAQGHLTEAQLDAIHELGLFSMFVPSEFGGLGLSLPEGVRLQEKLAQADGSLGWTITLCSGASWFLGFLDPLVVPVLFRNPKVAFGGSGMVAGTATKQADGGYLIHGHWPYATGARHLTIFTVNCKLLNEDMSVMLDPNGNPIVRSFWLLPEEVELVYDWEVMGLKATGSHSFFVRNQLVTESRMFHIDPNAVTRNEPVFHFPFEQFAEVTLAANYLGMFNHFFLLATEYLKEDKAVLMLLENELTKLRAHASRFYRALDRSWDQLVRYDRVPEAFLVEISVCCKTMVKEGLLAVSRHFPLMGMEGAQPNTTVNRVFRDLFTASQHVIFR